MTERRTALGAKTLAQKYYVSPEIFELERQRILARRWLCVGRSEALAGTGAYLVLDVERESIIMVRDKAGRLRAFYNVCRHRGTRLCSEPAGTFRSTIQCPYHAWTYGLDGALLGAPTMRDVAAFDPAEYPLTPVGAAEWGGFIFLNLAPEPQPFADAFAPLLNRLRPWQTGALRIAHQTAYDVAANWKLIFQNYSECYHCPTLHPRLNELTPFRDSWNELDEGSILGGPMKLAAPHQSMTLSGAACAPILPDLDEDDRQLIYYYTIFPNMFLSLHPDYVLAHWLERIDVGHTRVNCVWLFTVDAQGASGFSPADAVGFWDRTNREDWHICEQSQLGILSSAYRPGPYSELESLLAAFDRNYLRELNGQERSETI